MNVNRALVLMRVWSPVPVFCRWDQIQQLKDEKGHELLSTADVQSFLQSCQEAKAQLQGQLSQLDTVDVGCSSFTLQAEEKNQTQALRDIQALESKIAYLKSVAKMYGSDLHNIFYWFLCENDLRRVVKM